jgi:hypothetical protein
MGCHTRRCIRFTLGTQPVEKKKICIEFIRHPKTRGNKCWFGLNLRSLAPSRSSTTTQKPSHNTPLKPRPLHPPKPTPKPPPKCPLLPPPLFRPRRPPNPTLSQQKSTSAQNPITRTASWLISLHFRRVATRSSAMDSHRSAWRAIRRALFRLGDRARQPTVLRTFIPLPLQSRGLTWPRILATVLNLGTIRATASSAYERISLANFNRADGMCMFCLFCITVVLLALCSLNTIDLFSSFSSFQMGIFDNR